MWVAAPDFPLLFALFLRTCKSVGVRGCVWVKDKAYDFRSRFGCFHITLFER